MKKYILCFFLFYSYAFCSLLIEPYVGYGFSTGGEVENQPILLDFEGVYAGGRLGFTFDSFMVGLLADFMWFDLKATSSNPPYSYVYPTDQSNIGAFIGANFETGFRFWGEYFFRVRNKYFSQLNVENYDKGWGWGIGIGYAVMRNLAFNFQFRSLILNEVPAEIWKNDVLAQEILLTISFPVYPF